MILLLLFLDVFFKVRIILYSLELRQNTVFLGLERVDVFDEVLNRLVWILDVVVFLFDLLLNLLVFFIKFFQTFQELVSFLNEAIDFGFL